MTEDRSAGRWCEDCQLYGSHHTEKHGDFTKPRCQAILLMPQSRRWAERREDSNSLRCRFSAKPDSSFCGTHEKLTEYISQIVWK